MPLGTPIELTLYDENDEPIETYRRARIPVSFAERAMEWSNSLSEDAMSKDQLKALYQIIVDFFGDKFSVEQLTAGADLSELIAVVISISARVAEIMPESANPTLPGMTRRKKH